MSLRVKPLLENLSTVLVILAAGVVLWEVLSRSPQRSPPAPPVESVRGLSLSANFARHARGTGSVVLVEFSDYECPFCAKHAAETAPLLRREFVEPGKLQVLFLNFPLSRHARAQKASEAAECAADQGRFWNMHERLFQTPRLLDIPDLIAHAGAVGLDGPAFAACLNGDTHAERVRGDVAEGRRLGVSSTPTFFLGVREQSTGDIRLVKRLNGAVPFEAVKNAISDVSADAQKLAHR